MMDDSHCSVIHVGKIDGDGVLVVIVLGDEILDNGEAEARQRQVPAKRSSRSRFLSSATE